MALRTTESQSQWPPPPPPQQQQLQQRDQVWSPAAWVRSKAEAIPMDLMPP